MRARAPRQRPRGRREDNERERDEGTYLEREQRRCWREGCRTASSTARPEGSPQRFSRARDPWRKGRRGRPCGRKGPTKESSQRRVPPKASRSTCCSSPSCSSAQLFSCVCVTVAVAVSIASFRSLVCNERRGTKGGRSMTRDCPM